MPEFTEAQKAAIFYDGEKPAVVSAAAGSGKTAVLTERVMTLISDEKRQIDAGGLVIVTFTEKATEELSERLNSKLAALAEAQPDNEYLRRQQIRFGDAVISTISSFCRRLLDENIELLPLSQGFGVLGEGEKRLLLHEAVKKVSARAYKEGYGEIYRRIGDEAALSRVLERMLDFASNLPDEEKWFAEQRENLGNSERYCEKFYLPLSAAKLREADGLIEELEAMLESLALIDGAEKKCADLRAVLSAVAVMRTGISENDKAVTADAAEEFICAGSACRTYKGEAPFEHERYKDLRGRAKTFVFDDSFLTDPEVESAEVTQTAELLFRLYRAFKAEYSELKREKNVADFGDFEQLTLQILRSGENVRKRISDAISYIIVDEFQDSNDLQYEIFRLISRDEKNLYFVGDMKQSIYGFRGANPRVFARLLTDSGYAQLYMNKNFRSSDNVIEITNETFRSGVCESFNGGAPWLDMVGGLGIRSDEKNLAELVQINYNENKNAECEYIAKRIFEMVQSGYEIRTREGVRPCRYGDFAVLMRSESSKREPLRRALNALGIPNVTKGESNFTDLSETRLVANLLRCVVNPYDSASLTALMMSPLLLFSAEETAQIKTLYGIENVNKRGELFACVKQFAALKTPLGKKCAALVRFLGALKKQKNDCTLPQLLRKIYAETELLSVMNIGWNGSERVANLYLLLNYAESYCRIFGDDAEGFCSYISGGTNRRVKLEMEQAAVRENEDKCVRIMTIHGSKGLQFPVVFVANLNARKNERDFNDPFLADIDAGFAPALIDNTNMTRISTAAFSALKNAVSEKNEGEELRLLYVAMTRAEQKLIMTAGCKTGGIGTGVSGGSLYDFLLRRQAEDSVFSAPQIVDGDLIVRPDASGVALKKEDEPAVDAEKIRRNIDFVYPYLRQTKTSAKLTATQLGVLQDALASTTTDGAFYMGLPLFMKNRKTITPKERGDIYHKIIEHLDFDGSVYQLEKMRAENILTDDELSAVNPEHIAAFLTSPLAERIRNSREVKREFMIFTLVNAAELENPCDEDMSFVQGIADMFFIEDEKIVLVDYKTNRGATPEQLAAEYRGQLELYAKALTEMTGLEVKQRLLYSFELGEEIPLG